jgi:hypothetical protein
LSSEAKAAENNPAETYAQKPRTLAGLRADLTAGRIKAADLVAGY